MKDQKNVLGKKRVFNTTKRIEEMDEEDFGNFIDATEEQIDYEDEEEASGDLSDWDI